jgi:hypothetical protein
MEKKLPEAFTTFLLNDYKGLCRKYKKDIDFIPAKIVAYLIQLELDGELCRKDTREICERILSLKST